jgi:hypothetical protein
VITTAVPAAVGRQQDAPSVYAGGCAVGHPHRGQTHSGDVADRDRLRQQMESPSWPRDLPGLSTPSGSGGSSGGDDMTGPTRWRTYGHSAVGWGTRPTQSVDPVFGLGPGRSCGTVDSPCW